jgi:SAM-dependent methyltransferase
MTLEIPRALDGRTLREVLAHGALPARTAVDHAVGIARRLADAHEHGVVPLDLRPEHLFMTVDGPMMVGDVAALSAIHAPNVAPRLTLDRVAYLSPEEVRGEAVDRRSDVFRLGVVLHEMLTGERPFKGPTATDTMGAILMLEPAGLCDNGLAHVSPSLVDILRRCLQKEPAARFQTATDVAAALGAPEVVRAPAASAPVVSSSGPLGPLTKLEYGILRRLWPADPPTMMYAAAYEGKSKLEVLLGEALGDLRGQTVIDFGCGYGLEAIDLARRGAARVIGLDLEPNYLAIARQVVNAEGLSDRIEISTRTDTPADVVISLDAFEHFEDPAGILQTIYDLLRPGGVLVASFGPTWYHPLGGHLFSVFPWAHLIFSEAALLRWRDDRRPEGKKTFLAVGLNQMSVRRFERLVAASPFEVELFETVPIRRLKRFHNRLTREFFTSVVRCRLRRPV